MILWVNDIQPELKAFIEHYILVKKITNVDLSKLNLNKSLDLDLNLFDLDMDFFLMDFIEKFNIDDTNFNWKNYGYPRGTYTILLIRSFLNYKSNRVKQIAHLLYKPKISIYTLQEAIRTGVLV